MVILMVTKKQLKWIKSIWHLKTMILKVFGILRQWLNWFVVLLFCGENGTFERL